MQRVVLGFAAASALAGCMTADDVRNRPADWTAVYDQPWETMANCIQAHFVDGGVVTPQYNQRNRTAVLTVAVQGIIAPGPVVAEYRIRQVGNDDRSEVQLRQRPSVFGSPKAGQDVVDRCGRAQ